MHAEHVKKSFLNDNTSVGKTTLYDYFAFELVKLSFVNLLFQLILQYFLLYMNMDTFVPRTQLALTQSEHVCKKVQYTLILRKIMNISFDARNGKITLYCSIAFMFNSLIERK